MSEWTPIKLGSIVNITNGFAFKSENFLTSLTFNTLPVLKIKNVANGDVHLKDVQYHLIDSKYDKYTSSKGDILITLTGNHPQALTQVVGAVSKQKFDILAYINQRVAKIDPISSLAFKDFIYYFLKEKSTHDYLASQSSGSANQANISKADIENVELLLPPVTEQIAIASVLSSLDDKIDLLHRQNKTLESMANTLFRQWFIEDAHIHWTEKKLSSFGRIICGKTPSKKNSLYFGNDVPFLKIPDMHGKVFVFKSTDNLSFAGEHSQSKKTIPPGSICVSCIATVGLVCITDVSMQTNQQINSIIPNKEYYKYFLYLLMKSMGDELNNLASGGTATLNLNTGDFSNITFLSPSENELKIFHQSISSLFDKLKLNSKQINIIENLRDTLLPKLMSGEVRVQDAEEAIASVV